MTTFSHSVTDSATMLRRNLRHILRFPDVLIMSLGLPHPAAALRRGVRQRTGRETRRRGARR